MDKKITFIIPSMRGGGAEKVTMLLSNELINRDWEVTLLMCSVVGPYLSSLSSKIKIIKLKYNKISRNIFELKKYMDINTKDIFYSSMNYVNIVACISFALSKGQSKLIISEHNDIVEVLNNSNKLLKFIMDKGIKFFYKKADKIICVSKGVEESLNKKYSLSSKTIVIYNPIQQFNDISSTSTKPSSTYNILSIGRLTQQKNFTFLINAFFELRKLLPQHYLKLTILGEGELRKDLEAQINRLNLNEIVFLPGFDDISRFLQESNLFVLSSNREGFGNVIVEALSAGLPVVSTDCPSGPSEILENGKYGKLVPINDVKSLRDSMYQLLLNPNQLSNSQERKQKANEFNVEKIINLYESVFLSLKT